MKDLGFNITDNIIKVDMQIIRDEINKRAIIIIGNGVPSETIGELGNFYLDATNKKLYIKCESWALV